MALGMSSSSFLTHSMNNPISFCKKNNNFDLNFNVSFFPAAINKSKPPITHCQCATTQGGVGVGVGEELFSVTSSNTSDVDYLGESTKGDLYLNMGTFLLRKVCVFYYLFRFSS